MSKYTADIEIAVRGSQEINAAIKSLNRLNNSINVVNRNAQLQQKGAFNVANLENYSRAVSKAERAVRRAAQGTAQETQAVTQLVTAMNQENRARARKNFLIELEIANRRRIQAVANAGFGAQGAALPPSMRNAGFGQQGPRVAPRVTGGRGGGGGGVGGRMSGAISGGVIGGAFPLLFGQSGAAATGGAIGGLAGGLLGPGGSFAGSLLGTLIGQTAGQGNQIKELAADIGLSAQQTQVLATAFKQAGADFDKFAESVSRIQGVTDDVETQARAIQLASTLTEVYGGKIDKVTNAFTNALQSGKVTQATLNQLTSQGIPIQEALANKYDVSRSKLLQMAKDGKISVQDLIDTLVKVGNEGSASADKQSDAFKQGFAKIEEAASKLGATLVSVFATSGATMEDALGSAILAVTGYLADFISGIEVLVRVAGPALNSVIGWYVGIQTAIFEAVNAVPGLTGAVISFATAAAGPLAGVIAQMQTIAGLGASADAGPKTDMYGKYIPPEQQAGFKPLKSFNVPSQFVPTGGAGKKDKAANLAARQAEQLMSAKMQLDLARQLFSIENRVIAARLAGNKPLELARETQKELAELANKAAAIKVDKEMPAARKSVELDLLKVKAAEAARKLSVEIAELEQKRVEETNTALINSAQENSLLQAKITGTEKEYSAMLKIQELVAQGVPQSKATELILTNQRLTTEYEKQQLLLEKQKEVADSLATTFGEGLSSAFDVLIQGSDNWGKSLSDIASNVLTNIAHQLIQI